MMFTSENLPRVEPMRVRRFTPRLGVIPFGGLLLAHEYEVEDCELASSRLPFDEDVVDCSNRMLEVTTFCCRLEVPKPLALTVFPSRRLRSGREGEIITYDPRSGDPFLYLGNPIRVFVTRPGSCTVVRIPEFCIKSGIGLGY
jgi:hypothetical protein